jgi:hypothetical protein
MIAPEILRTLRAIDWDFASPRAGYVAPPHWYPGTFVPALSDALIEALTPPGGKVFDPYAGVGTTGWSAIRTGRTCHLTDLNPVAVLVSYVSTAMLALHRAEPDKARCALGDLARIVGRNDDLLGQYDVAARGNGIDRSVEEIVTPLPAAFRAETVIGPPNWDALSAWFAGETLSEMMRLLDALNESDSHFIRLLGLCMLSAVARSLNSQHASWGHIADNVKPKELKAQNVYAATGRWLKRTTSFIRQPIYHLNRGQEAGISDIHRRDWSQHQEDGAGDVDLLLTSPPYADAIDYMLSQRLSLYMVGYRDSDISRLVSSEIGARRKRFKSISRSEWSQQLCTALREQISWLKPKSTICLVLPHRDSGRSEGEDDIKAALTNMGWSPFFERDRSIHQSHTRQSWTSIKQETILAFARES